MYVLQSVILSGISSISTALLNAVKSSCIIAHAPLPARIAYASGSASIRSYEKEANQSIVGHQWIKYLNTSFSCGMSVEEINIQTLVLL